MAAPWGVGGARGLRTRITALAVAVTAAVLLTVGGAVVLAQRELLVDDLAAADAATRSEVAEATTEFSLLLGALPVVTVAVGTLVWWLVGRTLRPVERIRAEVAAVGAADLDRRVPVPATGDEVERLAVTMNAMLARLQDARDRQDRFVADAAHELRSPLARLVTALEVDEAHPGTADPSSTRRHLDVVRGLADLVDALLVLARPPAGDGGVQVVDLEDVVAATAADAVLPPGTALDTTGVTAVQVQGNERALAAVVRNLLDNAVRHARSSVVVTLRPEGGDAVLVVEDDGPGIRPEDRERVFGRFVRLDEARSAPEGGAGPGLAIVRDVVTRLRGTVAAQARGDGREGARLVVRLPLAGA